jgi:hypothetical protein
VLLAHFIGDAGPRQPHELGERSFAARERDDTEPYW